MHKILVSDPIADKGLELLDDAKLEVIYDPNMSHNDLKSIVVDINAWIVRSGTQITSEFLQEAHELQVIGRAGVGIDNIDIAAATNQGIVVMNIPDGNTISAAEHTVAMILALSRNIHLGHAGLLNGEWNRSNLVGTEIRGKILGIIGLGRIGKEVIKRTIGMEMEILGYDPFVNQDTFNEEDVKLVELDELTEKSDYITLHVPLIESTKNLFDMDRLLMMKPSARIINVARGGIVNEIDLANALNKGIISGAAIDVFENEPLVGKHPLIKAKNILITPHLGASTHEASEGVSTGICRQVRDYLLDEKLSNPLNMPISDIAVLRKIAPLLNLANILGKIGSQLSESPIKNITIECYGNIEDSKVITLSYLIGLLQNMTDTRLNYINAAAIAQERGISFSHSINTESVSFSNMVSATIINNEGSIQLNGSSFEINHFRIVNVFGYELDFRPEGNMIFVQNKDVPGVIGNVGSLLSESNVNIGEYLLSRTKGSEIAYSVIKVDGEVQTDLLEKLIDMDEILSAKQVKI